MEQHGDGVSTPESLDAWGWQWLEHFVQDLRFGARTLVHNPGFAATTILTLALATGATTAIFSIVNSVLLRPLPFASPDRLVQVAETWQIGEPGAVLYADLEEFRRQSSAFEAFAGYGGTTRHLQNSSGSERLTAVLAERDFFRVLGVEPIAGRTFGPGDQGQLAVISARLWRQRFDQSPEVIGRPITLAAQAYSDALRRSIIEHRDFVVLGVMPDRFQFPYGAASIVSGALPETRTDIWVFDDRQRPGGRFSGVTGRMKPGITVDAAASELSVIKQRIDAQSTNPNRPTGVRVRSLSDVVLGGIAPSLWLLVGAVALVLVAACANVANLLLARTAVRAREVATRMAIGAGRMRLVRQFLTESLLLSFCGGLVGAAIAWWGTNLLVAVGSAKIPRAHEVALDWFAFGFLLLICLTTAMLFGLAPALTAAGADVQSVTKDTGGRSTMGRGFARVRDGLVITEIALAFMLAFGAAVVIRELDRLQKTDTGMVTDHVLTFHLTPRATDQEYFSIEERVRQATGVEAAGFIQLVPLQNWGWIGTFRVQGRPRDERLPTAELRTVTPGYFRALGIPLQAGRELTERDSLSAPRVLVINDALVRLHFAHEDPIGRETDRGTIVGVVGDVRQVGLDRPAVPEIYQVVNPDAGVASDIGMSLLVKAPGERQAVVDAVRAAVREVNPTLAIFNIRTMEQVVSDSLWELNLYRWLIGLFAALALVLAAIGLYGVISYGVTSRTREFAVRLALGSDPVRLARAVINRGVRLALSGLGVGAAILWALTKLAPNLPGNLAAEPVAFTAITALVLAIALVAGTVPAVRVARADPASSLRHE